MFGVNLQSAITLCHGLICCNYVNLILQTVICDDVNNIP